MAAVKTGGQKNPRPPADLSARLQKGANHFGLTSKLGTRSALDITSLCQDKSGAQQQASGHTAQGSQEEVPDGIGHETCLLGEHGSPKIIMKIDTVCDFLGTVFAWSNLCTIQIPCRSGESCRAIPLRDGFGKWMNQADAQRLPKWKHSPCANDLG